VNAPPASSRRRSALPFALLLSLLLAAGAVQQALLLNSALTDNPFTLAPLMDAKIYWDWAARIAAGDLLGSEPFFSAPLYPYLLGLLRALGGGLSALFIIQAVLHLATATALASAARRLWGAAPALAAALLYLLLDDPAFHVTRVLNCTLQAFLVALVWERMTAPGTLSTRRGRILLGFTMGLLVLANPTFLVALPAYSIWAAWRRTRNHAPAETDTDLGANSSARTWNSGLGIALSILIPGLLTIAPATLHNALACGELIPVSSQAGITFYHGNQSGADGTYHQAEGVSADRRLQNLQARTNAGTISWRATDAHYFARGLSFWTSSPGQALALMGRRARWFVSGRNYGDVYQPGLEARDGFRPRAFLAPMPVAWCVLPALLCFFILRRSAAAGIPEALLFLLPALVVIAFWYSPRYRMPAVPLVAALAAAGPFMARVTGASSHLRPWLASLLVAMALGPLNRATGFDLLTAHGPAYDHLAGVALSQTGQEEAALARLEAASAAGHQGAAVTHADLLRRLGHGSRALSDLRRLARENPNDAYARRSLARALAEAGLLDEARDAYQTALDLDATDPQIHSGLGNVLLTQGQASAALAHYDRALELDGAYADARYNRALALDSLGRRDEARGELLLVLGALEDHAPARLMLAKYYVADGEEQDAAKLLRRGVDLAPGHRQLTVALAWHLATSPSPALRNGAEALVLLETVTPPTSAPDPGWLDAQAAALSQTGKVAEAATAATAAVKMLRSAGLAEWALEVDQRAQAYSAGRTWHR
jgi:tetratricopeptide (TPR) repeat protein